MSASADSASDVSSSRYTGQCYCGAVQFAVTGKPAFSAFCHCSKCRIMMGFTAPTVIVSFPAAQFQQLAGHDAVRVYNYRTETLKDRVFCSHCGTRVWSHDRGSSAYRIYTPTLHVAGGGGKGEGRLPSELTAGLFHINYDSRLVGWPAGGDDGLVHFRGNKVDETQRCSWDSEPLEPVKEQPDDGNRSAQCECGDVRYKLTGKAGDAGFCHCSICRSLLPSEAAVWVTWRVADVQLLAEQSCIAECRAGRAMISGWCRRCGTRLYLRDPTHSETMEFAPPVLDFSGCREATAGRWPWPCGSQIWLGSKLHRDAQVSLVSQSVPCFLESSRSEPPVRCDWRGQPL